MNHALSSGSKARERSPVGLVTAWLCGGMLLLLIYALGIGPAYRIYRTHPRSRPALDALYSPVWPIVQHAPPLNDALNWYLGLWEPRKRP